MQQNVRGTSEECHIRRCGRGVEKLRTTAEQELVGTYKLISTTQTILETGQAVAMNDGSGFIMYGRDGRMMAIMLTGDRPTPVSIEKITDQERIELFRSMIAYGGTYTFDGKTVEHHIDISWNGVWTGTTQIRDFKREQGRIILTTRPAPSPLRWQDGLCDISVGEGAIAEGWSLVWFWHFSDVTTGRRNVCCWGKSGSRDCVA